MKKAVFMISVFLFAKLLVAQELDVSSLLGESWYGLYMKGQKAGYAMHSMTQEESGEVVLVEDARFRVVMLGVKQDMHIYSERRYAPDGALISVVSRVEDPSGVSEFDARVAGKDLLLVSKVGNVMKETTLPKPRESLADAVKHAHWVLGSPGVGDVLNFSVFEPLYQQEISGVSHIVDVESRVLDGVRTKVYKIKTSLDLMGIDSVSYVTDSGETLEDVIANVITMRLETEENAKDIDYSNDVIVSNAAMLDGPILEPRERLGLRLKILGPLSEAHMFSDERQSIVPSGEEFLFTGSRVVLDESAIAKLPIRDEEAARWLEPSTFVQSDDPRIVEKAREIVGDETNTWVITQKLCAWVHENMRSTFSARLTNAVEVLDSMEGDCTEHSVLFIGLARAAGLPAREVAGLIYMDNPPGFFFHQWAKVWVGKWIDVDPTFGQPLADVTHIKLAEGDLFKQAKLIPVIGNLSIEVVPDRPPPDEDEGKAAVESSEAASASGSP